MSLQKRYDILLKAVEDIAKGCSILAADKDGMHNERAANLFLRSTVRRMELAKEAIKEVDDLLEEEATCVGDYARE